MLQVGAELFNAETHRQFRQKESSSLFWQDEASPPRNFASATKYF
jgi:hypothetical protein